MRIVWQGGWEAGFAQDLSIPYGSDLTHLCQRCSSLVWDRDTPMILQCSQDQHTQPATLRPITSPLLYPILSRAEWWGMPQNAQRDNNYKNYHLSSPYLARLLYTRLHVWDLISSLLPRIQCCIAIILVLKMRKLRLRLNNLPNRTQLTSGCEGGTQYTRNPKKRSFPLNSTPRELVLLLHLSWVGPQSVCPGVGSTWPQGSATRFTVGPKRSQIQRPAHIFGRLQS